MTKKIRIRASALLACAGDRGTRALAAGVASGREGPGVLLNPASGFGQ